MAKQKQITKTVTSGVESASFVDPGGPVYVLIGTILNETESVSGDRVKVYVAPGNAREYGNKFLPVLQFFGTPRTESEVLRWLSDYDDATEIIDILIDTHTVVKVDTFSPTSATRSLKNLRIVAQTEAELNGGPLITGLIPTVTRGTRHKTFNVTFELGYALWGPPTNTDLPKFINLIAEGTNVTVDTAARQVLTGLPTLLTAGYARLEWLRIPGEPAGQVARAKTCGGQKPHCRVAR